MTEKHNHEDRRFGQYAFLGLWVVIPCSIAIMTPIIWNVVLTALPMEFLKLTASTILMNVSMTLVLMALGGIAQQVVIYQYWGYRIRQWWWVTAMGFALASFLTIILLTIFAGNIPQVSVQSNSSLITLFIAGITSLIPSSLQASLLQRYFDQVWWYVVAYFGVSIVTSMLNLQDLILTPTILGLVSGITLLWLARITDKDKGLKNDK